MSNLVRVSQALYCEPWLIRPDVHAVLRDIVSAHVIGGEVESNRRALGSRLSANRKSVRAIGPDGAGDGSPTEPYDIVDGVAVVPLIGVVGYRMGSFEKSSGGADALDFIGALAKAEQDSNVTAVVLNIDSPGGTVSGVAEAAAAVSRLRASKPVISFADSMMASSAYWIGCAADMVYCGQFASVGSVGVYLALLDSSRAYEKAGYKTEMFKSGDFKGMGADGTALTDSQRAFLQDRVDALGSAFRAHVTSCRPVIDSASLDGRDFLGADSLRLGFVDAVATMEQTISDAARMAAMTRR